MTHKELRARIDGMTYKDIEKMSPRGMSKLTDGFCEELIKYILAEKCYGYQLNTFRVIKDKYDKWRGEDNMMWNIQVPGSKKLFPKHFDDLEFDLECGMQITPEQVEYDDATPDTIEVDEEAEALVINRNEKDTLAGFDRSELQTLIGELEEHNKELKAKNSELTAMLEESQEEIEWHDKVRLDLLLRLIKKDGAVIDKHGNKIKVARIMQAITGLPLNTCKNYCTNRDLSLTHHKEEILKLNAILQALGMEIRL